MFFLVGNLQSKRISLTFALFFMVLDLRLVKIGCRETINFFLYQDKEEFYYYRLDTKNGFAERQARFVLS